MSKELIYKRIASKLPELDLKLQQAGMKDSPQQFVKKTLISAFYLNTGIAIVMAMFFSKLNISLILILVMFPILLFMLFTYFLKYPDVQTLKIEREIDKEIVFAGRHLIIELESGMSVYEGFKNIAVNYPIVGKYFNNIVKDIDFGTPMDDALNRAVNLTPSKNFRKMLWQIINSMTTGGDIASSLNAVVEQIVREQKIALNEYGRKLNPLAMFYMIVAVVLPSIGITMFAVAVSFIGIDLGLTGLLVIAGFMGIIQFLFFTIVKS
ncbi:type II secretion system F family protein, partial [Nanoarchaeota archaeon]